MSESDAEAREADLVGRVFGGRYTVVERIGEGGMASVWRARTEEGSEIALKALHVELAKEKNFAKRFRREAEAASRIEHPSVVRVLDHGLEDGRAFIAMELVRGEDLFALFARHGRLPEAWAASIVVEVLGALSAAHAAGIVHRDLKPENVMLVGGAEAAGMVDPEGPPGDAPPRPRVKVLDFGIAKLVGPDASHAALPPDQSILTRAGTVVGTPEYIAPELGRGEPPEPRSDLYACGVLLYQLVTGVLPFSGETPMHTLLKQVSEPPCPPGTLVPLHPGLEALILRALAKRPEARFPDALAMREALLTLMPTLALRLGPEAPRASPFAASAPPRAVTDSQVNAPTLRPGPREPERARDSAPPDSGPTRVAPPPRGRAPEPADAATSPTLVAPWPPPPPGADLRADTPTALQNGAPAAPARPSFPSAPGYPPAAVLGASAPLAHRQPPDPPRRRPAPAPAVSAPLAVLLGLASGLIVFGLLALAVFLVLR